MVAGAIAHTYRKASTRRHKNIPAKIIHPHTLVSCFGNTDDVTHTHIRHVCLRKVTFLRDPFDL